MTAQTMDQQEADSESAATGYCLFETAFGVCGLGWGPSGLTHLQLPEGDRFATERRLQRATGRNAPRAPDAMVERAIAALHRYFAGEREDFRNLALDLAAVPLFHGRVYEAACALAWGETVTYGELARSLGTPDAARAVGQALSRNPIPVIVPCHRILAAGRQIGGFSAHGGRLTKVRLLALEGVNLGDDEPLLPGLLPAAVGY